MSKLTIAEVVAATNKSRSTIVRMIEAGQLTKEKNDAGITVVDESEVFRVFPESMDNQSGDQGDHDGNHGQPTMVTTPDQSGVMAAKDAHIRTLQDSVDTLNEQLKDSADNYRRIAGLLTHEQERSTNGHTQTETLADTIKTLTAELEASREEQRRLTEMVTNEQARSSNNADDHELTTNVQELTKELTEMRNKLDAVTSDDQDSVISGHHMVNDDQPKRSWISRVFA